MRAAVAAVAVVAVVVVVVRRRKCQWKPLEYSCLFGIVGGLGPKATSTFVNDLIQQRAMLFRIMQSASTPEERFHKVASLLPSASFGWTLAQVEQVYHHTSQTNKLNDQDHVPLLVAQATSTPSRPRYILKHEDTEDPAPQLRQVAQALTDAGATHLAIVCNTAHYFWPQMKPYLPRTVEFIDMIQLTLDYISVKLPGCARVGVLATLGTLECGLIQGYASRFEFFSPLDISLAHQQQVERCIFGELGIKTGFDDPRTPQGRANLLLLLDQCAEMKQQFDIQVVVLFCSELPLVLFPDSLLRVLEEDPAMATRLQGIQAYLDPSMLLVHEVLRLALCSRRV
ncbi:hypothetical protein BASA81_007847 [Batrachochytrium salamandrivorans]|nr:hypothetical protein BASA81_007847 [Batrachochytrium salamandrivorans]